MKNQRGQATVLIGIIFQVVFVFFAMVINVGLLINDKINLQNSVDIAAYYGAMKQAEVLNTIAHVNYQIRQAWKLFNWRLWSLGDSGRTLNFAQANQMNIFNLQDQPFPGAFDFPVVCIRHALWWDEHFQKGTHEPQKAQNWCKREEFEIPSLKPLQLSGFLASPFFAGLRVYEAISRVNANNYSKDCKRGGADNFYFAAVITASYKISVAHRRNAIRNLEKLLVDGEMRDILGQPVRETVKNVLLKNLTLANKESLRDDGFYNSLQGKPFLVPIDVRLFPQYQDIFERDRKCTGNVKNINVPPVESSNFASEIMALVNQLVSTDIGKDVPPLSADAFMNESPSTVFKEMRSLVGVEKNPWLAAYVKVKATTQPRMLFSPTGASSVVLTAEGYAMPFGGRIGPSYRNSWPSSSIMSTGNSKIDPLLSPRIGEPTGETELKNIFVPNYSRYPGDKLGMKSQQARVMGLKYFVSQNIPDLPHLFEDDYEGILKGLADADLKLDPLVTSVNRSRPPRKAELIAVAPDLFDAAYYSVEGNFNGTQDSFVVKRNANGFLNQLCPFGCEDLGSYVNGQKQFITIKEQIDFRKNEDNSYWKLVDVDHLRTGWAQKGANDYSGAEDLIGAKPTSPSMPGGRVGYSVKIVSDDFLRRSLPWGGSGGGSGQIKNPPP